MVLALPNDVDTISVPSGFELGTPVYVNVPERLTLGIRESALPKITFGSPTEPMKIRTSVKLPITQAIRKESISFLFGGFITYLGLQAGNPVFVFGGVALVGLYLLRNYL